VISSGHVGDYERFEGTYRFHLQCEVSQDCNNRRLRLRTAGESGQNEKRNNRKLAQKSWKLQLIRRP
jgi:hypothetical protein